MAVQHLKDEPYDSDDDVLKATVMEILQTMKELVAQNPLYREQMQASKGLQVAACLSAIPWGHRSRLPRGPDLAFCQAVW